MADYPLTVIEVVERLESEMSEPNKNVLKNTPRDKLEILHLTLGVWIRDYFGLGTGENEKLLYSCAENSVRSLPTPVIHGSGHSCAKPCCES